MWQFLDQIEIYPLFSQVLFLLNFIPCSKSWFDSLF